jgi:hypothetical protein
LRRLRAARLSGAFGAPALDAARAAAVATSSRIAYAPPRSSKNNDDDDDDDDALAEVGRNSSVGDARCRWIRRSVLILPLAPAAAAASGRICSQAAPESNASAARRRARRERDDPERERVNGLGRSDVEVL